MASGTHSTASAPELFVELAPVPDHDNAYRALRLIHDICDSAVAYSHASNSVKGALEGHTCRRPWVLCKSLHSHHDQGLHMLGQNPQVALR
jgi:hypothetical protein